MTRSGSASHLCLGGVLEALEPEPLLAPKAVDEETDTRTQILVGGTWLRGKAHLIVQEDPSSIPRTPKCLPTYRERGRGMKSESLCWGVSEGTGAALGVGEPPG